MFDILVTVEIEGPEINAEIQNAPHTYRELKRAFSKFDLT
jgi:hypothetical protein